MKMKRIHLEKLVENKWRTNVARPEITNKIKRHIRRHGCYEPLIVRKKTSRPHHYEILNGHLRKQILTELGYTHAYCVLWTLNGREGRMALATLNGLHGKDDPIKHAQLLEHLASDTTTSDLVKAMPQTRKQLNQIRAILQPIEVIKPRALETPPQAMTFFVRPSQKAMIEAALAGVKHAVQADDPQSRSTRGELLAILSGQAHRQPDRVSRRTTTMARHG